MDEDGKVSRSDLKYLTADSNFRRETATAVTKQLREKPPHDDSVDEADSEFTDAIMRKAEIVMPRKRHKRVGEDGAETTTKQQRQKCIPLGMTLKRIRKTSNSGSLSAGYVRRSIEHEL